MCIFCSISATDTVFFLRGVTFRIVNLQRLWVSTHKKYTEGSLKKFSCKFSFSCFFTYFRQTVLLQILRRWKLYNSSELIGLMRNTFFMWWKNTVPALPTMWINFLRGNYYCIKIIKTKGIEVSRRGLVSSVSAY